MKRVLFLAHSALAGGAEYCLDITLRHLDREQIEPLAIFPNEGPMTVSARSMGIPVEIWPFSWWMLYEPGLWEWRNRLRIPGRVKRLTNYLREHQVDCVYTNTACIFEGALAAERAGIPHVTHIHEVLTDAYMRPRWFSLKRMTRFFYRKSSSVIFESRASADMAQNILKDDVTFREKTRIVSNSSRFSQEDVPQDLSREAKQQAKTAMTASWELDDKRAWVLWIGRFSERKNPLMLIRAAERLRERTDFQVVFLGAGPLESTMRLEIAARGLQDICKILPFQSDIRPFLTASDLLVLTSNEESFGLVVVEAGMFRLPVIATRVQGPSEILQENTSGFLVPVDDDAMLAVKLEEMLKSRTFRREMGRLNQRRILCLYDPVKNTRKLESFLDNSTGESF